MNTRDFAASHIRFDKSSPISGAFRLDYYPFLGKPMDAADDIECKRLVIYKASSCMGTVLGQIINAKRIVCDVGDQKMVCQSDDDAELWTKTRGKEWLKSIPDAMRLLSKDKYAVTNTLWLFRHKFLELSGPGINSAQSVQVRYIQTDESHLDAYGPGCLTEFEKRMGGRWDRNAVHITTAPAIGKEIDTFFLTGNQNEWHWRCPKCAQLVWPLWEDDSKQHYNGHRVLFSHEGAMHYACPHCEHTTTDTARARYDLVRDGDYVSMNPTAPKATQSFRWSAWSAAHWIAWADMDSEYQAAMESAKLGDYKPYEDFCKKRKCKAYEPTVLDFSDTPKSNYNLGDVWITEHEKLRVASFDFQEGHGAEGIHWWGQVDEFARNGDSRRVDYKRLESWADCRGLQERHLVANLDTYCDSGHRDKEVFAKCALFFWQSLISSDDDSFNHTINLGGTLKQVANPYYTQLKPQDSMSGQNARDMRKRGNFIPHGRRLPIGWCWSRTWSKPNIGYLLLRIKDGRLGREYGIAANIIDKYTEQLNSYIETTEINKRTGARKRILKQVKESDHAFATSSQCLLGAIIRGYFPVANQTIEIQ